ncbi:hypothetical protein [Streptomyces mirabilis]
MTPPPTAPDPNNPEPGSLLSTLVQNWDVGVLTTLAICIGASAVAPR